MAFRFALCMLFVAAVSSAAVQPNQGAYRNPVASFAKNAAAAAPNAAYQAAAVAPNAAYQAAAAAPNAAYQAAAVASQASARVASAAAPSVADQQAQITQQSYDSNPADNSFNYGFQSNNGIAQQAHGYFNQNGKYVIEGSYTLYTKEGTPVSISYVADENGYNAVGDAIPKPDAAIVKAVEYLRSLPPQKDEQQ